MTTNLWTVEAGRLLVFNGMPVANLIKKPEVPPVVADELCRTIVGLLNFAETAVAMKKESA